MGLSVLDTDRRVWQRPCVKHKQARAWPEPKEAPRAARGQGVNPPICTSATKKQQVSSFPSRRRRFPNRLPGFVAPFCRIRTYYLDTVDLHCRYSKGVELEGSLYIV